MTPRSLLAPARLGGQPILRAQTDERLVELASAGSRPAFEAIVSRYRRPLLSYSARFLGAERAEDAVQQTFVKVYTALTDGEVVRTLRPWLYRIAHNISLNMLRDRAPLHEPLTEQIDGVERPDQAAERRQELHQVLAAVQALPPRQRDAMVLQAIEGRTYEQIAEGLGISDGAVRQLLSRARCSMRAGFAALTPVGLLARIAAPLGDAPATLVAGSGGGSGTFAAGKLCAATLAAAIAGGGVSALEDEPGDRARAKPSDASAAASAPASARRPALASTALAAGASQAGAPRLGPRPPRGKPSPHGQSRGRIWPTTSAAVQPEPIRAIASGPARPASHGTDLRRSVKTLEGTALIGRPSPRRGARHPTAPLPGSTWAPRARAARSPRPTTEMVVSPPVTAPMVRSTVGRDSHREFFAGRVS